MTQSNDGWMDERIYTVIRNRTKNSKVVLSTLNGIEIAPGQTLDLRTTFRKAQVQDAVHEIASLIKTGHLEDWTEGKPKDEAAVVDQANKNEMAKKMEEAMIREVGSSSSLSFLEDQMASKNPVIAKAAKIRSDILMGLRDDEGVPIPGAGPEEAAKPTEFIRSQSSVQPPAPAAVPAAVAATPADTAPVEGVGSVRRAQ